jgi:hypothetical protein
MLTFNKPVGADLSAWGAYRRAIGRYIGGAGMNAPPTGITGSACYTSSSALGIAVKQAQCQPEDKMAENILEE